MHAFQPIKTVTVAVVIGWGSLVYTRAQDFTVAHPQPVLHAAAAYSGGTIMAAEGGYYSPLPYAPIEVKVRKFIGGAALPDS